MFDTAGAVYAVPPQANTTAGMTAAVGAETSTATGTNFDVNPAICGTYT